MTHVKQDLFILATAAFFVLGIASLVMATYTVALHVALNAL
jgi:hypothetical protein